MVHVIGVDPSLSATAIVGLDGPAPCREVQRIAAARVSVRVLRSPLTGPARLQDLRDAVRRAVLAEAPTLALVEGYSLGAKFPLTVAVLTEWGGVGSASRTANFPSAVVAGSPVASTRRRVTATSSM